MNKPDGVENIMYISAYICIHMYETVNAVMLETALANPVYVIVKLNDETPKARY